MTSPSHFRILLVDDNPAIHDDFCKILLAPQTRDTSLEEAEAILFEAPRPAPPVATFEVESAFQGVEALERVREAVAADAPYALAFIDVRMPPGWDGIATAEELWRADPALQVVICTAYADYSWEKMAHRLGASDSFVILKKPFDNIEVLQLAHALTKKWKMTAQARLRLETLDAMVCERTASLELACAETERSEERFATAFRASPAPLAIQRFDDQRFVDVNDAFAAMTGFAREELLGSTPLELALCIDYEGSASGRSLGEERIHAAPAQVSTRGGEMRQALLSIERIALAGEPHLLLMAEDISERTRLEAQLRQAQKMEAVGQLAAGIAHDFNNLLTVIQGHASLQLAAADLPEDLAASLGQIEHAADRAAELTRQLLTFSRRGVMRPRALDLPELIDKLGGMLRRLIGEQIELRCELPGGLPPVLADPTSIEQVIINLTVNARDAMPRGGVITIRARAATVTPADCAGNIEAQPGEFVCLSVGDTGVGMDETTRLHIFEPFFTTKETHKGTGMGLATVYGIARQHGGWIEVATAPGQGSTFEVFLPVTAATAPAAEPAPIRPNVPRAQHTVLVVEDDEAVRDLVKEILLHHGYRVIEAEHADAAFPLWAAHAEEIELLLTDMVMPGSANGLELARQLLAQKPELKVIYTSGYSAELFASDVALEEGVNYLPKPYLTSKLTSIVRNALEPDAA